MRRLNLRAFALLVAATCVSACAVGPDFHPAVAPKVADYTSAPTAPKTEQGGPVAVRGEGPGARWWTAFGSTELDGFVDQAIAHNPSLEASNARLGAARERIAAARGHLFPQLDANARYDRQKVNLTAFGFDPASFGLGGNPEFELYSVGAGVSFDLDLFGGNRRALEAAGARAESQLRQTEAAHLALAGQVTNQVLVIATLRARIATAEALLAEDSRTLDLTQKRKDAGEGTLVEVLNAQTQLQADRAEIPPLRQQLAEARNLLALLIGVTPAELGPTDVDLDKITLPAEVPVTLPSTLIRKRPDILEAEAQLHAATADVGVATARLYPNITLGAAVSQGALNTEKLFSGDTRGFDLFSGVTTPIFHGGTLRAERRASVEEARAADATYRQTVLDAFRQVADLLSAIETDQATMREQRDAVDVAQRSLGLSRRSFEVGNSGLLQVLDSERLYQRAASNLVDIRGRQLLNVGKLYVATAGGWIGKKPTTTRQ